MRKKIIFGSVFAVVVIIFASFSSVASVRTINSNNLIENIKDKIENVSGTDNLNMNIGEKYFIKMAIWYFS